MFATLGMYKENKLTECLVDSYSIFHIINQPPIYGVIVYFLLCHESMNYCPGNSFGYRLGLYHGLVSLFAANNTKALIVLLDEDARTVRLR